MKLPGLLDFYVDHLTPAIEPVIGVDAMGHMSGAIGRIFGQKWCLKAIGAATFGAAHLGMFAFGLCHGIVLLNKTVYKEGF